MINDLRKVVWVLGTGFSAPLGGPMLEGLLSRGVHSEIAIRYKAEGLDSPDMKDLIFLYNYGRRFKESAAEDFGWTNTPLGGEQLWEHAEDFLDVIDTCAETPDESVGEHLTTVLSRYGRTFGRSAPDLRDLAYRARKHVAAECCSFLDRNKSATERWRPYERWATELVGKNDEIVTFNDDCLLELLGRRQPFADVVTSFGALSTEPQQRAQIYKLHGSTNWIGAKAADDTWNVRQDNDLTAALRCNPEELVIATPGPSKTRARTALGLWWGRAESALSKAGAVVFLGYRFPPSDSDARSELLGAIAANEVQSLSLHTVLGPTLNDATVRLEQMLHYTARSAGRITQDQGEGDDRPKRYDLQVHRLYSQDFMSLATRERLLRP